MTRPLQHLQHNGGNEWYENTEKEGKSGGGAWSPPYLGMEVMPGGSLEAYQYIDLGMGVSGGDAWRLIGGIPVH